MGDGVAFGTGAVAQHLFTVEQPLVLFVDIDLGAGGLDDLGHCHHMIVMAMGQQDHLHLIAQLLHGLQNLFGLLTGIDEGAGAGLLVTQNIAVGLQPTNDNVLDDHMGHTPFFII